MFSSTHQPISQPNLPKIAIVGRPNVGKSALFNRICQKRISIVDEAEGVTRDRLYAEAHLFGRPFVLIDTGGIDPTGTIPFAEEVKGQAELAIREADLILFVVDGRVGVTTIDEQVARILRKSHKPVLLLINKMDQGEELPPAMASSFASLGIGEMMGISAIHGYQIVEALEWAFKKVSGESEMPVVEGQGNELLQTLSIMPPSVPPSAPPPASPIRVAIVGRPNVGKSTLLNKLLNEHRSIESSIAGTTRDAIDVLVEREGKQILFIDTAGIRRKKSEKEEVDKFAAIRTQEALERADVILLVCDSLDGFTVQEMRIAAEIERLGKSCILLFNKWDLIEGLRMEHALRGVREAAPFLAHCPALFLSATLGRNVAQVWSLIDLVYQHRFVRLTTGALNQLIEGCLQKYTPPMITGKRLRIYYLTQVAVNPPRFVLFVNRPNLMTPSYRKFLINQLRKSHPFTGSPLLFELKGKKGKTASPVA